MEIGNVRGNYKYSKYGAIESEREQSLERAENVETLNPNTRLTMKFLDHKNVSPRMKNIRVTIDNAFTKFKYSTKFEF